MPRTRSQACTVVGGCPMSDACSRAGECVQRRNAVAECVRRRNAVADLRECSTDPPCGSATCSACELQRMDRRLGNVENVKTDADALRALIQLHLGDVWVRVFDEAVRADG